MSMPTRLPVAVADKLAERALRRLVEGGLIPDAPLPGWGDYRRFRQRVRDTFQVPQTTVTPLMARLLYGIAYIARPARILVVGSYYGNTLVWLAGPGFGPHAEYEGGQALGVDVDAEATGGARANLARLGMRAEVQVLDGHHAGACGYDLVLLDADDPVRRKAVYRTLLAALRPNLGPGALVLAHDICVPLFADDMAAYKAAARDIGDSMSLEIDACGLEISRVGVGA
jgi:predicted O-methyltransferase YrrM